MSERRKVLDLFEEQKEYMEERVNSGIEQYRKGYAKITVKDKNGNVVSDAKIKVNQKSHEFKFGANLFMLDELETDEKNEAYKKYFADVFNMATLPFYWNTLEPEEGKPRFSKDSPKIYRRPPIDLCMEFCKEHGIEPREHCLNYDIFRPEWLSDASVETIKKKLEERMRILAERYSKDISCWEVINETLYTLRGDRPSAFYYEPDLVEWSFKTAEKYFKSNKITINESNWNIYENMFKHNRSAYYMQIERAIRNGARIDAIGMQFHMCFTKEEEVERVTKDFYDPEHHYSVMDTYAQFGKPLQITEVTIPAYSNNEENEVIQAEILEKLYSIWFSHPNMEQIIYWNLVDGYAYVADPAKIKKSQGDMTLGENYYYGGLLRFDMTPKPAYYTIKNLIQKKWHTETEVVSDVDGMAKFKGFYGEYDVEITANGKTICETINLSSKGCNEFNLEI